MKVCYFVSEYPAVSHTFIRREIAEIERQGLDVTRVSVKRDKLKLVDPADLDERDRTRYLLDASPFEFVRSLIEALAFRPIRLFSAAFSAARMTRKSCRPPIMHFIYLAEAILLSRWLIAEGIGHVHSHFGTNGAEVAMLARILTSIPYSFTVHGPDEFDRPEYMGLPAKVKHAAFVCAVSWFTKSQICRWIDPSEWAKIKIVRCGLDAAFTGTPPARPLSKKQLVCIGRLSEQKGQIILLDALARLVKKGVPVRVTLAGDGHLAPKLRRHIDELGLGDHVDMPGWLTNEEIRARILEARAVVLPSFAEGLPVVLMEALALGRPVITTLVAGTPELVGDGVCGWLVPAGSDERLAAAIEQCLNASDSQIQTMGEVGRARVLDMHDIRRECAKLASLFGAAVRGVALQPELAAVGSTAEPTGGNTVIDASSKSNLERPLPRFSHKSNLGEPAERERRPLP